MNHGTGLLVLALILWLLVPAFLAYLWRASRRQRQCFVNWLKYRRWSSL